MSTRIISKAAMVLAILACTGCDDPKQTRTMLLVDPASGCQYVGNIGGDVVSPNLRRLLDANGKPICREVRP